MTPSAEQRAFLLAQKTELQRLLEGVRDHPLMAPPLEARLRAIELELAKIPAGVGPIGRAAILFTKGGVEGTTGIEAKLSGDILAAYEQMFEVQARHDQMAGTDAKRFTKRFTEPRLLLTSLPRGSVGFELVPQETGDFIVDGILAEALRNLTSELADVAESDEKFADVVQRAPMKVFKPMQGFLRVLVERGTEIRMITGGLEGERRLDLQQLTEGLRRLGDAKEDEEVQVLAGTFKGITVESFYFEFLPDGGRLISGIADTDALSVETATRFDQQFTNKACNATIRVTTIKPLHGKPRVTHELLDVVERERGKKS